MDLLWVTVHIQYSASMESHTHHNQNRDQFPMETFMRSVIGLKMKKEKKQQQSHASAVLSSFVSPISRKRTSVWKNQQTSQSNCIPLQTQSYWAIRCWSNPRWQPSNTDPPKACHMLNLMKDGPIHPLHLRNFLKSIQVVRQSLHKWCSIFLKCKELQNKYNSLGNVPPDKANAVFNTSSLESAPEHWDTNPIYSKVVKDAMQEVL